MPTYKTPGVYVREIDTFPPSVAEVETAIPAFMGFTKTGPKNLPTRITSILDYQLAFGSADAETKIVATVQNNNIVVDFDKDQNGMPVKSKNVMFYALQMYFANGGGPCWIVSIGGFGESDTAATKTYTDALSEISKEDEPTLLVFPDAPYTLSAKNYYDLQIEALRQCQKLGDRFAILDVVDNKDDFRNNFAPPSPEFARYGAAYYPYLKTTIPFAVDESKITVVGGEKAPEPQQAVVEQPTTPGENPEQPARRPRPAPAPAAAPKGVSFTDASISNALKNQIRQKIKETLTVDLPPSAAVAGVYASVDSIRGVWKAPANVSLSYVKAPAAKITDDDQESLNIDVNDGKSINAIRAFIGKGTKIWGARTLDGNSNDWRYINVRRFFNMVEESIKKSTGWAVFEPNDINTWTKVRAMIENYLILKWKDGALAGAKPDDAFFVRVGLGQTMTPQDVLEGSMIVEIGLAAVRPAEFIVLKFSHKLQTS